jgi:tetratricopeptide (TPR) repeat protein
MAERTERQAEAERALRRGELKEALAIFRELLVEAPDDPQIKARIAAIESLVQPRELSEAPAKSAPSVDRERAPTLEETAETLFENGDVAGAIAVYERILRDRPEHELARERCAELKALHVRLRPETAESIEGLPMNRPDLMKALLARIAVRRKS